jgi:hypothetical protein
LLAPALAFSPALALQPLGGEFGALVKNRKMDSHLEPGLFSPPLPKSFPLLNFSAREMNKAKMRDKKHIKRRGDRN